MISNLTNSSVDQSGQHVEVSVGPEVSALCSRPNCELLSTRQFIDICTRTRHSPLKPGDPRWTMNDRWLCPLMVEMNANIYIEGERLID